MSEPTTPPTDAGAGKPAKLLVVILAVAGLVLGMAGGAFVAAPLFASRLQPAPVRSASTDDAHEDGDEVEEGGHESGGKASGESATSAPNSAAMYTVDNLVTNPAGTGGTRFIMVTVAFQLGSAAQVEALRQRDAEVRDVIVSLFSRKSVDELSDATRRDSLRMEVTSAVAPLMPKKAMRRVFFPQFVIQ